MRRDEQEVIMKIQTITMELTKYMTLAEVLKAQVEQLKEENLFLRERLKDKMDNVVTLIEDISRLYKGLNNIPITAESSNEKN